MFTAYHGSEVKNILFIHSKCLWYSLLGACYAKLTTSTFSSINKILYIMREPSLELLWKLVYERHNSPMF